MAKLGEILGTLKVKQGKVVVVKNGQEEDVKKTTKRKRVKRIKGFTPREIEKVNDRIDEAFEAMRKGKEMN